MAQSTSPMSAKRSAYFRLTILAYAAIHVAVLRLFFVAGNDIFLEQASAVFKGQLPYRDFIFEYPPLALAALLPPRIFGSDSTSYGNALGWEMLLLDVATLVLVALAARRLRIPVWQALGAYTAAMLTLGSLVVQRYDLLPALLVTAALFCFTLRKYTLCWVLLALAVGAKLYPAVLVPLLALYHFKRNDYASLTRGITAFAVTVGITFIPWAILAPAGVRLSMEYQLGRGLQIETTYASALMAGHTLGMTSLQVAFLHGADDLVSPLATMLASASSFILPLALLATYAAYAATRPVAHAAPCVTESGLPDSRYMALFWSLSLAAFLLTGKVLSPQFLIWLIPLLALASGPLRWIPWVLITIAAGLTHYIFPSHYYALMDFKGLAVGSLVTRNVLLVAIALLLLKMGMARRDAQ
ncbi:MAG: glycosyltransferase 87 family protein [Dehalococcoidia bacterium]|nr:glycosyltransferase 87 family protein [Dehalococcoidia bacterium]